MTELQQHVPGKRIHNYDELADEIVRRIRLATTETLPDEFFAGFGPYSGQHIQHLPFGHPSSPMTVYYFWTPPGEFRVQFRGVNNQLIQEFLYVKQESTK